MDHHEHFDKGNDLPLSDLELAEVSCKIVDFGNACWTYKKFANDIQTRQYRSPEVNYLIFNY